MAQLFRLFPDRRRAFIIHGDRLTAFVRVRGLLEPSQATRGCGRRWSGGPFRAFVGWVFDPLSPGAYVSGSAGMGRGGIGPSQFGLVLCVLCL